ncbi:Ger(x)C family spore germination protein [Paenibacillus sp. MWE-103]|uniref:Ger(X)C family spore germination protein n=1 Tax=Paenibacillus artemisiicola TaxID=1172618 RepID=A0ABS3W5C4_9BACL|nr:Ger(x)C family spore germination protein [Paenibacillus artemisiicola]MBO7743488.1 Ger(x)C family spore germination protein [Paenibacillus artemisiicola]
MKQIWKAALAGCMLLFICGCWDVKNIQYFNFINMIGVDYVDGKYRIYAQINELSSMAKQEGGPAAPNPVVVGKGEGVSIELAMYDLRKESQMRTDWTQNKVFFFTDRLLEKGIFDIHDELMRTRDQRYTPWVFATNEDLAKVFSTKPITGTSPVNTMYFQPNLLYKQMQSSFKPVSYQSFVRSSSELYETSLLDHVGLSENWDKDGKPITLPIVNGLIALRNGKSQARFGREEVSGVKWLNEKTSRGILPLRGDKGTYYGTVTVKDNKLKKKPVYKNGKRTVELYLSLDAVLREQKLPLELKQANALIKKNIEDEITQTYENGKKRAVDIYSLNEVWYRKGLAVDNDIPGLQLHVNVKLMGTNMFELRERRSEDGHRN